VRTDWNCLTRTILKSIKEDELYYAELRQILADIVLDNLFDKIGKDIFKEDNYHNKIENLQKIREDSYFLGLIFLE